jgi:NAD-dependent deacetylase
MTVLFLTGAGISANAGIATYRDGGSSWTDSDLEKKSHASRYGNHLDELWDKHWGPTEKAMRNAEPTYTHKRIADFQKTHDAIIATQNIDDLHEKAGSDNVAHLHGVMRAKCMKCSDGGDVLPWYEKGAPACVNCWTRKTRPDVVLFGEMLDMKMFKALNAWSVQKADYVVAIGSSLNVYPAAALVLDNVKKTIIVNKESTGFSKMAKAAYHQDCDDVIDEVLEQIS